MRKKSIQYKSDNHRFYLLFSCHKDARKEVIMTFEEITRGLKQLLSDNNYNPATIRFYEREWSKIQSFLIETYGDTTFDMERGLSYLENKYSFQTRYNDGTL